MSAENAAEAAHGMEHWRVIAAERRTVVVEPAGGRDALPMGELVPLMASFGMELRYVVRGSGRMQFVEPA